MPQIDLHGLAPTAALRRLAQALHAARVRGAPEVLVVTGRGWGNRLQEPKLRTTVESWLAGPEGRRVGARLARREPHGGALVVALQRPV
ncbi:MAG: Smr/MutS family protein [Planctomycetes bacterium]|nr:Smr/MutS family protein [Planctomycetota bacterium]